MTRVLLIASLPMLLSCGTDGDSAGGALSIEYRLFKRGANVGCEEAPEVREIEVTPEMGLLGEMLTEIKKFNADPDTYRAAVADWVEHGAQSRFALAPHEVVCAASGREALALCQSEHFDAILCDLVMLDKRATTGNLLINVILSRGDGVFLGPPTYFIPPEQLVEYQAKLVEAFGPVSSLLTYDTVDQAADLIHICNIVASTESYLDVAERPALHQHLERHGLRHR